MRACYSYHYIEGIQVKAHRKARAPKQVVCEGGDEGLVGVLQGRLHESLQHIGGPRARLLEEVWLVEGAQEGNVGGRGGHHHVVHQTVTKPVKKLMGKS